MANGKLPYFFEEGGNPIYDARGIPLNLHKAVMKIPDGTPLRNWFGEEYKLKLPRVEGSNADGFVVESGIVTIYFDSKVYLAKLGPKIEEVLEDLGFKQNGNLYAVCANRAEFVDPEIKRVWDNLEVI